MTDSSLNIASASASAADSPRWRAARKAAISVEDLGQIFIRNRSCRVDSAAFPSPKLLQSKESLTGNTNFAARLTILAMYQTLVRKRYPNAPVLPTLWLRQDDSKAVP